MSCCTLPLPGASQLDVQHTHSCANAGHNKAVSSISLDPTSTRVLSGSRDYTLHMYDFGGMKSDMKAFRSLTPCDGHPVLSVSWSTTGELAWHVMSCTCTCLPPAIA